MQRQMCTVKRSLIATPDPILMATMMTVTVTTTVMAMTTMTTMKTAAAFVVVAKAIGRRIAMQKQMLMATKFPIEIFKRLWRKVLESTCASLQRVVLQHYILSETTQENIGFDECILTSSTAS